MSDENYSDDEQAQAMSDDDFDVNDVIASDDDTSDEEDSEKEDTVFKEESEYNKEVRIVNPENRILSRRLSDFEQTRLVCIRAEQIALDGITFVDCADLTDPIKMGQRELMTRMIPIMCRRPVGERLKDGTIIQYYEDWDPNTMEFSTIYTDI